MCTGACADVSFGRTLQGGKAKEQGLSDECIDTVEMWTALLLLGVVGTFYGMVQNSFDVIIVVAAYETTAGDPVMNLSIGEDRVLEARVPH